MAITSLAGEAAARELYRHPGQAAPDVTRTDAHRQCETHLFSGTILRETTDGSSSAGEDERIFNCMRSYGKGAPMLLLVAFSPTDAQACKLYLYTLWPGENGGRRLSSERFECTSSRLTSPNGLDPEGIFSLNMIWPAEGAPVPPFLEDEFGRNIGRVPAYTAPAFFEFARTGDSARGLHGYPDINMWKGSSGCVRMLPEQAEILLERFQGLHDTWGNQLGQGWWRNVLIAFNDFSND